MPEIKMPKPKFHPKLVTASPEHPRECRRGHKSVWAAKSARYTCNDLFEYFPRCATHRANGKLHRHENPARTFAPWVGDAAPLRPPQIEFTGTVYRAGRLVGVRSRKTGKEMQLYISFQRAVGWNVTLWLSWELLLKFDFWNLRFQQGKNMLQQTCSHHRNNFPPFVFQTLFATALRNRWFF